MALPTDNSENTEPKEHPVIISEDNINSDGKDDSEILIDSIQNAKLALVRELYEILGENFGDNKANVEVRNYFSENPLQSGMGLFGFGGDPTLGDFGGGTLTLSGDTSTLQMVVKRGEIKQYGTRMGCFGKLYINGQYFCDCAERATTTTGQLHPVGRVWKVAGTKEQGAYKCSNPNWTKGDKWHAFYPLSNGYVPQIKVDTGASGICIHQGSGPTWSEGCLIVGELKNGSSFTCDSSYNAWVSLYRYLLQSKNTTIVYT